MVSVPTKKMVVRTLVDSGFAKVSDVCRAIGLSRTSFYAPNRRSAESIQIEHQVVQLSQSKPRYGYRRITEVLKREGLEVNSKRIQAIRKRHGIQVRKKQRRTRRVSENESERLRSSGVNEVWSWDFVHDQTEHGASFIVNSTCIAVFFSIWS